MLALDFRSTVFPFRGHTRPQFDTNEKTQGKIDNYKQKKTATRNKDNHKGKKTNTGGTKDNHKENEATTRRNKYVQ